MATIRKLRKRWQAIVRRKRIHVSKTFWKKSDARLWSDKTEAQIEVGSYLEIIREIARSDSKTFLVFHRNLRFSHRI